LVPLRIPSLDGLRALSICLVLLSHLRDNEGFAFQAWNLVGATGMRVFFVISGFLIFSLLKKEILENDSERFRWHSRWEAWGSFSLGHFCLRRVLRIFPAFYTFLVVLVILQTCGVVEVPDKDILVAAMFRVNLIPGISFSVAHLWSLSIAVQFCLLAPMTLYFLGWSRCMWLFALLLPAAVVARTILHWDVITPDYSTEAILIGCLLVEHRDRLWSMRWYRRFLASPMFWTLPALVVVSINPAWTTILRGDVIAVAIAVCCDRFIRFQEDPVGRLLNWRPVMFVGSLSYSLYLWQQIFFDQNSNQWFTGFPQNLVLTGMAAYLSYWLVERPFLGMQRSLEAVRMSSQLRVRIRLSWPGSADFPLRQRLLREDAAKSD
jgi:peptidoglycan/LPS O-acetylase OafA/YrhL